MLLVVDVGNTNISLGVFLGHTLKHTWRIATDPRKMLDEYGLLMSSILSMRGVDPKSISDACICSVVPPLTPTFEEVCHSYLSVDPLTVTTGVKTGLPILYEPARDVGADRVADAVAGVRLYGKPLVIVDFGTATVFDAISPSGEYLGGAISPGINLSAEALFLGTSQLRRVELSTPRSAIGRNTVISIQSGLIYGHTGLVEGMIARFKAELGPDTKVVATGGMAHLIAQQTRVFDVVNSDLTLYGLKFIYDLNRGQERED